MAFIIVDDDELILHALKDIFEVFAVPFETFSDPELAMRRFRQDPDHFTGALLDYNLGYTTGLALADEMKMLNRDIQFMFCTATSDLHNRNLIEERGIWLAKPINAHTAFALIRYFIELNSEEIIPSQEANGKLKEAQNVCAEALKLINQLDERIEDALLKQQVQNLSENLEAISKHKSPPHETIYKGNIQVVK